MQDKVKLLQMSQEHETPLKIAADENFAYRFAYARAVEIREVGDPGQDYIAILNLGSALLFTVCDGVSQSFMGNFAAQYLGNALIDWLENELGGMISRDAIQTTLNDYLIALTKTATERVQQYALPPDIPEMLREVQEQKRALGSQSTFVCGRIDLPCKEFPQGRFVAAWMGDSRLRVWSNDGSAVPLGGNFATAQRWATNRGPLNGRPNVYSSTLQGAGSAIQRIMAYTDGIVALDDWKKTPSNTILGQLIKDMEQNPKNDDIAFFEVWIGGMPLEWEQAVSYLAAPHIFDSAFIGGNLRLAWRSVSGATQYEVACNNQVITTQTTDWELLNPAPGLYRVRVRAWQEDMPGTWSEWQQVTVPTTKEVAQKPETPPKRLHLRYVLGLAAAGILALMIICVASLTLVPGGIFHKWLVGEPAATVSTPVVDATASPTIQSTPVSILATPTLSPTLVILSTPTLTPTATMIPEVTLTPTLTTVPTVTFISPLETPTVTLPTSDSPLPTPTATLPLTDTVTP